jgi:hypothetical protein
MIQVSSQQTDKTGTQHRDRTNDFCLMGSHQSSKVWKKVHLHDMMRYYASLKEQSGCISGWKETLSTKPLQFEYFSRPKTHMHDDLLGCQTVISHQVRPLHHAASHQSHRQSRRHHHHPFQLDARHEDGEDASPTRHQRRRTRRGGSKWARHGSGHWRGSHEWMNFTRSCPPGCAETTGWCSSQSLQ